MKLYLFSTLIFSASILLAQENALTILDDYHKAIGDQSNIIKIQSIYSFADCYGPNGPYKTEVSSAKGSKGSKTFFRQIRTNRPDYIGIVHGEYYWTKGEDVVISNKNSASMWRSHELQWIATHLKDRFHDPKYEDVEEFNGTTAHKLSVIDDLNKMAYLYFDKHSDLFLGFTILNPFTEHQETIHMMINKWEKIKNILLPSKVEFKDKNGTYVLNFHTIKINQVNPDVFDVTEKIIATKKLMELHELQRKAHFDRDAKLLVSLLSEDYKEISNGKISSPTKENLLKRFQNYFNVVTFIEWDDKEPPVIKISDDLTIAYMHVNKRVKLKINEEIQEPKIYAWTATFKQVLDDWVITSITSTDLENRIEKE